ncbi:MAG: LytTR family DNA-binding domain-containing protein [Pseudomonadota bacterium]
MSVPEERHMALIAGLCVLLIASHDQVMLQQHGVFFVYVYAMARVGIGCALFFAARAVLATYWPSAGVGALTASAIAASHLPFVLAITALDIVLGEPELGMAAGVTSPSPGVGALLWEALYLADNHIALCLLLSLPRLIPAIWPEEPLAVPTPAHVKTLLGALDPPLDGSIVWVEAQEHYVRLTTDLESRLVLARFSDIVRELSDQAGMQVHRSHWVARDAVVRLTKSGQTAAVLLSTGDNVPVSRSYRQRVESALAETEPA